MLGLDTWRQGINIVSKLPPMPPNYHGWWNNAHVERIQLEPIRKCKHEFILTKDGAQCIKCNLGFLGEGFKIRDGKLYNNKLPAH